MDQSAVDRARAAARHIRCTVLRQSNRAGVGHIGSALSVADVVAAVYASAAYRASDGPDRNRFVLSKGHAALALYAALHFVGQLCDDDLDTYCGEDTLLGVHPDRSLPGVDFSTGSLGQGVSMAVGAALAARIQGSERRVTALVSDAECNEGSVWEAAMFAAHHRLSRLTVIVDANGQQALDHTERVSMVDDMSARWRSFGWDAEEVDGHDLEALLDALEAPRAIDARPHVLVARTTFGYGVTFMERQVKWHYLPMSADQFADALAQVEALP